MVQHNSKLTARAQELRRNMTKEERRLRYEYLRQYPYRFRRQVAFESYILENLRGVCQLIDETVAGRIR